MSTGEKLFTEAPVCSVVDAESAGVGSAGAVALCVQKSADFARALLVRETFCLASPAAGRTDIILVALIVFRSCWSTHGITRGV